MKATILKISCLLLCGFLLVSCGAKKITQKGGSRGTKPYTVLGKTYYPLKSAQGFVEEGIASWYGPGFHGKPTASGEKYNQYAMTAAHKILPLGTRIRVTNLGNGRSVLVTVNDRGPFVENRVIDLSRAAASRLDIVGSGTGRVRLQSLGGIAQATTGGDIKGKFYIQAGAFGKKENAANLINLLTKAGHKGRLIYGNNNMWNVQIGPWEGLEETQKKLNELRQFYPKAFVVGGDGS